MGILCDRQIREMIGIEPFEAEHREPTGRQAAGEGWRGRPPNGLPIGRERGRVCRL